MFQLFRQRSWPCTIDLSPSLRRGLVFEISAGFSGSLDSSSGMSVPLPFIDQALDHFIAIHRQFAKPDEAPESVAFQNQSTSQSQTQLQLQHQAHDLLLSAVAHLQNACDKHNETGFGDKIFSRQQSVRLTEVRLTEKRGWTVSWQMNLPPEETLFTSEHFLESPMGMQVDVLRMRVTWSKKSPDAFHFPQCSLELLKNLRLGGIELGSRAWRAEFKSCLGVSLSSSAVVVGLRIDNLSRHWTIQF